MGQTQYIHLSRITLIKETRMLFPDELGEDKEARREYEAEYWQLAEDKQIAEGDITVSETVDGQDPTPDIDDDFEDLLEDDDLVVEDLDELALSNDPVDHYLDDDEDEDEDEDDDDDLNDDDAYEDDDEEDDDETL